MVSCWTTESYSDDSVCLEPYFMPNKVKNLEILLKKFLPYLA